MQSLILYGFKGAGKSTLGKQFAQYYDYDFIDTDTELCRYLGWEGSISDLYLQLGPQAFRAKESEMIRHLKCEEDTIIATGGGTVLDAENVRILKEIGPLVYLETPPDVLYARMQELPKIPAFLDAKDMLASFQAYYQSRVHYYPMIADAWIDATEPNLLEALHAIAAEECYGE